MSEKSAKKSEFITKCFNRKTLISKAIIVPCAIVLVLSLSLSFYFWLKDKDGTIGENPFWYIKIVWNSGIGFGGLDGNLPAIYSIQSLVFIALIGVFIFVSHDRISASFISLAMFGGLFNLIQRACEVGDHAGCVLDYFQFGFWESFPTFNWPDMCVVIGVFGFVISYITVTIIEARRESINEAR